MTRTSEEHRGLGANIIQRLLQHRRPFLFVDRIKGYRLGETRSIEAAFQVSVSHPVFDVHFPDWSLWPGVYIVEGLGQTAQASTPGSPVAPTTRRRAEPRSKLEEDPKPHPLPANTSSESKRFGCSRLGFSCTSDVRRGAWFRLRGGLVRNTQARTSAGCHPFGGSRGQPRTRATDSVPAALH